MDRSGTNVREGIGMQAGRENKFRGMDIAGEWHYGNLAVLRKAYRGIKAGSYISNEAGVPFAYAVRPETVGQYSTILDMNGKEIYEGDIVQYKMGENNCVGTIKFGEYEQDGSGGEYNTITCLGFFIHRLKIIPTVWDIEFDGPYYREEEQQVSPSKTEIVVIGNEWQNPELMEKGA
jgi:uncharacterized phage protein (TIGR01671 family)